MVDNGTRAHAELRISCPSPDYLIEWEAAQIVSERIGDSSMPYTYVCAEFPGMESCRGKMTTATEKELWQLVELHGRLAHEEDPMQWSQEDRDQISAIIRANSSE